MPLVRNGEISRDAERELYEEVAGRSVGDTTWYEVFAVAAVHRDPPSG